jgi:uncharacterized membrane protein (TIGR02234 family)
MTPVWARKPTLVLLIAVLALAVFGATTQTWITVNLDPDQLGQAGGQNTLPVQGSKAATAVTALAVVALAGGLAASIAGRIARILITAIIILASAGIITAAATVLSDPLSAAQGSIAAATGITGGSADVRVTAFPVLAVVAGALLGLGALLIIPAGRYWKVRTKYDVAAGRAAAGTGGAAAGAATDSTATSAAAGGVPAPAGPVDEIDSWDRLSQGDDPT